jgi:hypothetical protein
MCVDLHASIGITCIITLELDLATAVDIVPPSNFRSKSHPRLSPIFALF